MIVTVNGDDFGWSKSCSCAILEAFDKNIIQTTTMISTGAFFDEASQLVMNSELKNHIGIHFDLTEGVPLTDEIKKDPFFCNKEGEFLIYINRYKPLTAEQKRHAYNELRAQAERFKKTGLLFHHADSHHHIHTAPFILPIVLTVAKEYNIKKIRGLRNHGNIPITKRLGKEIFNFRLDLGNHRYTKLFCSAEDYLSYQARNNNSTLEIMVHPDYDSNGQLIDRDGEATYETPYGSPLIGLAEGIKARGDILKK